MHRDNVDITEIAKFSEPAWWEPEGIYKSLHAINPHRLAYINERASLPRKVTLDIGCGGGILTESMARLGAEVTGIDMSEAALNAARERQLAVNTQIEYLLITAEELARKRPEHYDVVTCLEMLEHVPDPASIVRACAQLVKPGGQVFFATLNRNFKAYLFAILGAEYILKLLPTNTHDFAKFIRPSELDQWARQANLNLIDMAGISYNIVTQQFRLTNDVSVNYLAHFKK